MKLYNERNIKQKLIKSFNFLKSLNLNKKNLLKDNY